MDEKNIYFTDHERGTVNKVSKDGGPVITLVKGLHNPWMIIVHEDKLYFTEGYPVEERSPGQMRRSEPEMALKP